MPVGEEETKWKLRAQCESALECTVLPSVAYRQQSVPENQTVCSKTLTGSIFHITINGKHYNALQHNPKPKTNFRKCN